MAKRVAIEVISALLCLLFIYAGLSKLLDHHVFSEQLERSPFIGNFAPLISYNLPFLELLVAVMLVCKPFRHIGLEVSLGLMLLFTLYVGLVLGFSKRIPCTCGSLLQAMTWRQHLIFNIVFTAIAYIGVILQRRKLKELRDAALQYRTNRFSQDIP